MQISELQISQVNKQIEALRNAGSFYGKKLEEAGITGISSQEDFEKLPFSEKDDLRDAYPLGLMTAPEDKIVRIHSSSGTTGVPVIIPYTAKDVDDWAIMFAPFMVLMIATMPRYFYLNLLLETLGYGCVVLGHALTYSNFFFGDTMKSMLMSRILSEDAMNYVGSLIYYLVCQLGMKTWIFPACNSVWIAVIFTMAFLGCPRGSYDGKDSLKTVSSGDGQYHS